MLPNPWDDAVQVLLNVFGLREYIFDDGPRGNLNLIGQNREGIFQMFGFCAIYLVAASMGRLIADQPFSKVLSGKATTSREDAQNVAIGLVGKLLVLYVGLWALQAAAIMCTFVLQFTAWCSTTRAPCGWHRVACNQTKAGTHMALFDVENGENNMRCRPWQWCRSGVQTFV